MKNNISVIIPTYHNTDLCVVHVREIMNSIVVPDEIVVVDDCGDPAVKDRLAELPKNTKVIYARINEDIIWNYNGACNLAVWLSHGEFISIEDVDHIPLRDAYKNALGVLEDESISRVTFGRNWVPIKDVLEKPFEEWQPYGKLGPNQMVTIIRRDVYLKLKGQDERLCGRYGFMAYNWAASYRKLGIRSKQVGQFYIVKDAEEQGMKRGMSLKNRQIYRENANSPALHSPHGILNFTYEYCVL